MTKAAFFKELPVALAPGRKPLISEPAWHVKKTDFERTLETALSV